jgi:putative transcriptional regulator
VRFQAIGYIERGEYDPSLELGLQLAAFFGDPVEAIFFADPVHADSTLLYGQSPRPASTRAALDGFARSQRAR